MNKFKPVLSICIPCYKRINQVRNTLNSIYEANSEISMDDYEVIRQKWYDAGGKALTDEYNRAYQEGGAIMDGIIAQKWK